MRSHHADPIAPPDPPVPHAKQLNDGLERFLLDEAGYTTGTNAQDYADCGACGRAIGFGETVAYPDPHVEAVPRICWHCLIGILLTRACVDVDDVDLPTLYMNGTGRLHMAAKLHDYDWKRGLYRRPRT